MALFAKPTEKQGPSAWRLTFVSTTGYILPAEKSLFHNQTKLDKAIAGHIAEAKARNAAGGKAEIIALFKDKDSGLYLPCPDYPIKTVRFGTL